MPAKKRTRLLLTLILVVFGIMISSTIITPEIGRTRTEANDDQKQDSVEAYQMDPDFLVDNGGFALSQESQSGILDPVQVKQTGFQVTDAVRARTDTGTNSIQNITIDDTNNWFANYTEVEVSNLKRLYGVNGTFEDGVNPWTNYTIDGGANTQIAGYDADGEYITCKNVGDYKWASRHEWTHSGGSEVGWQQVVSNPDGKLDFTMSLDFRYVTGPIDPEGDNALPGYIGVFYQVASDGWYYPMETLLNSHDAWYTVSHEFTIPSAWSSFSIYVGLYIAGDIKLYNDTDYDDDPLGLIDDTVHAENITLYIDNVEFTGNDIPSFEEVELTFNAGALSSPITGTTVGTATLSNPSYWTVDPFEIEITSNTTVVFTYTVTTLYHRYVNTSWTTDPTKHGVSYSINSGESAELGFYTYVTSALDYEDMTVDIQYPRDWENATIWDPLRNNITDLCTITPGLIHVPNTELDRIGWWEIDLQAPNYAKNISIQMQDTGIWSEASLFRPTNLTRTQVNIGTASTTPISGSLVNITWHLPNETIWASDSIASMINGEVNSSIWTFGQSNTSAGQWEVEVLWTNGSEIAFDSAVFEMYHTASLSPRESVIVTDDGLLITNMVYYVDEDTGEYIVDASATIVANWSTYTVTFTSNPVHNWYEADFDTSIVGGGIFRVIVNASIPYFDDVSCEFVVESTFTTTIAFPDIGAGAEEIGRNEIYKLNVSYLFTNGTGIDNAQIEFAYSGPALGLSNSSSAYLGSGIYTLDITGLYSGEYIVTITCSKSYHYSKSKQFTLIVGETDTNFVSLNGTADLVAFGSTYRLVVHYTNSTDANLIGADVLVTQVTPSTGLIVNPGVGTPIVDEGNGLYSVNFTPTVSGSYTILLKANMTNHVTQYLTFTILVTDVSTTLTPHTSSATILIDQSFTLQLNFEDESSDGIEGAVIALINPPSGITGLVTWQGGGLYNFTLTTTVTVPTSFELSFKASLTNYKNASTVFSLLVQNIPTDLEIILGGSSDTIDITETYNITLSYLRLDIYSNISSANIAISTTPSEGLAPWWIVDGEVYQLGFSADRIGIWQISISASLTKYVTSTIILELEVVALDTIFSSLNGTVDEVGYGLSYRLVLNYTSIIGIGLSDSWVNITEVDPEEGLTVDLTIDAGNGIYSILFTPTIADTYTVTIRANITNHITRYLTFSLLVVDTPTVLIPSSSGTTISVDQNYTLYLTYQDTLGNPIDGAIITLVNIPSGLAYDWNWEGSGVYNVTLDPSVTESISFQLSFRASRVNYQTSSTAFTLFVQIIPTTLEVIVGQQSDSINIIEEYVVTLAYLRTDTGENITSADFEIATTPSTGYTSSVTEVDGVYQLTFQATSIGIWQIVVTANRTYFVSSIIQLELEVLPIDTSIISFNGTADLVSYGDNYRISLQYRNSTGHGILYANMSVTEVTPSIGMAYSTYSESEDGVYSIILSPSATSTFSIVLRLNITNHVTQYFSFSLVVTPIQTVLIAEEGGATISLDQSYTVQLEYKDELDQPVLGATITIPIVPTGLSYSFSEIGNGFYNVTLVPSVLTTTTFQVSLRASLANYQNSTTAFSLLVQIIPTELRILHGVAEASILFGNEYQIVVAYVRTDTNENVSLADFDVYALPGEGIIATITHEGDVYLLSFTADSVGVWEITITANKTQYITSRLSLDLEVNPIATSLNDVTLLESLIYSRTYDFAFSYSVTGGSIISNASVAKSGSGANWATVTEDEPGQYTLSLSPNDVGSFEVTLTFSKGGYISRITTLEFNVREASISIIDIQGLTGLEGSLTTLSLRLVDSDTGEPISGASVAFQLIQNLVPGSTDVLEESDSQPGLYSASYLVPTADSENKIRFYVELDNYQLEDSSEYYEADIVPTVSDITALTRTVTQYSPLILLAIVVASGYAGRRSYRRRKRKENLKALAIKRRFDDVRNMLGVVVLHKDSGIPVYSRMLKGGFDDSLISAFITAISQFRSEFDVTQKEWVITPISDIIMAIRTQNLVCAFITSGNPTKTQEERMIRFAQAVGLMFDSDYEEAPILSIDDEAEKRFDDLFDEMLDMHLHRRHKIIDSKKLPRGPKCLNSTIAELESADAIELEEMADKIAACGLEEAKVYKIIMDAIERKDLIQIEDEISEEGHDTPPGLDESIEDSSDPFIIKAEDADEFDSSVEPVKSVDEKDKFIEDVEALLSSEKEDDGPEDDNPERLDVS